jgi:aminopeptidase N
MMQTLVGREGFRRGMDLYFQRHDGQAVTCDDFAQAIADANPGSALTQRLHDFQRWYAQAGTPRVQARVAWDAAAGTCKLTLTQRCPATPGQPHKAPFVIPVCAGLLARDGRALPVRLAGDDAAAPQERLLVLESAEQSWTFIGLHGLDAAPVPSLLRGFSAPVVLEADAGTLDDAALRVLLSHDTDPFNRWEAGQRLLLNAQLAAVRGDAPAALDEATLEALRGVLRDPGLDAAFKELTLQLPTEGYVAEQLEVVDPQRIHAVREALRDQLAQALHADWLQAWEANQVRAGYEPSPAQSGQRALAGLALAHLCRHAVRTGDPVWPGRAYRQVKDASNMTDRLAALSALVESHAELATPALERFHALFRDEALVVDKWFMLQARAPEPVGAGAGATFTRVKALMQHPDFTLKNPNRARSLLFALCMHNPAAFHRADAAGYVFWAERVLELDAFNPQVAARLARALDRWKALAEPWRGAAREALARVAARPDLSGATREIVGKALGE